MYGRILLAIDGTMSCEYILEQAVRLAGCLDADLHTISVQEWTTPLETIGTEVEVPRTFHDKFFEDVCARIRRAAEGSGVRLKETAVFKGNAASQILRHVEEVGFDYVVLGRRGGGLRHRLRWTSTAHRVMACSPCPVIVFPDCSETDSRGGHDDLSRIPETG